MISRRSLETATAVLTGAFGAAVVVSSVENGIGWSSAGVDAGTFPFLTGLIILLGSLFNLVQGWLGSRDAALGWNDLKRVAALFVPAAVYVGMIPLLGMYVASGAYVFGTVSGQARASSVRGLILATVTAVALYLVFERMFQVSLPRGLLGDALGF
jgi:Tripartite tricarboxylate transporter TctB family